VTVRFLLWNVISFSGSVLEMELVRELIGKDPEIGEEFEVEA
jgi:hypothetical protein